MIKIGGVEFYMGPKVLAGPTTSTRSSATSSASAKQPRDRRAGDRLPPDRRGDPRRRSGAECACGSSSKATTSPRRRRWPIRGRQGRPRGEPHHPGRAAQGEGRRHQRPEPEDLPPEVHRPRLGQANGGRAHRLDELHPDRHRHERDPGIGSRARTSTTSSCCTASGPRPSTCASSSGCASGTFGDLHERVEPKPEGVRPAGRCGSSRCSRRGTGPRWRS